MADEALQTVEVGSRAELRLWLAENCATSPSVFLVTFKKHRADLHIPYSDVVDELLCFGWVDSLPRKLDEDRSMLRISPRKASSNWSLVNRQKAERLIEAGQMQPPGLAVINAAKAAGHWDALGDEKSGVEALDIPDDLAAALALVSQAPDYFAAFPRSTKRAILEWINAARTTETRSKRIGETARLAGQNIRANQWRQPKSS